MGEPPLSAGFEGATHAGGVDVCSEYCFVRLFLRRAALLK